MNFIRKSYKRRMFICFLTLSVVFILISGLFSVQLFRMKINRDFVQNDLNAFGKIRETLTSAFEMAETALNDIRENEVISDALRTGGSNTREVNSELFANTRRIRDFSTICIYENGECTYSTSVGSTYLKLPVYFSILKSASLAEGNAVYSVMDALASQTGKDTGSRSLGIAGTFENTGTCVIRIDSSGFDRMLDGLIESGKGFILANEFWEPVYVAGTANVQVLADFRNNIISEKDYAQGFADNAYARKLGDTGLWGIFITPPVMIGSAVRSMYTIIMILTVISIALSLFMSNRLSDSLTQPIGQLTKAMKRLRNGDLDARVENDREDEFGQLATGFNKMSGQLKTYMEERIEKEKELNRTQIGMVTAQLNPHFLYNTLDTIKWLAKDNGVQTIADLSSKLAKILRRSISGPAFCSIGEELELVRNYCDIQAVRFDNKFEIDIRAEEGTETYRIPKLIIQPVVENSIIHGLENYDSGHIEILVRKVNSQINDYGEESSNNEEKKTVVRGNTEAGWPAGGIIVIMVTDNGCGIDDDTARKLRNRDREGLEGHIGLLNVDTIIRLNYGNEYGLTAERTGESGTRVTITLPAMAVKEKRI